MRKGSQQPPGQSSRFIISTPFPRSFGYSGLVDVDGEVAAAAPLVPLPDGAAAAAGGGLAAAGGLAAGAGAAGAARLATKTKSLLVTIKL